MQSPESPSFDKIEAQREAVFNRFAGLAMAHRETFMLAERSEDDLLRELQRAPGDMSLTIKFTSRALDEERSMELEELRLRTGILRSLLNGYSGTEPLTQEELDTGREFSFELDHISEFEIVNVRGGRALRMKSDLIGLSTDAPFYGTFLKLAKSSD